MYQMNLSKLNRGDPQAFQAAGPVSAEPKIVLAQGEASIGYNSLRAILGSPLPRHPLTKPSFGIPTIIFVAMLLSGLASFAFAQTYYKENAVEVLVSGGRQEGGIYHVIGTIAQPASTANSSTGLTNSIYPGYISNLNSRIITEYEFEIEDTAEDSDSDANTQVAGVYFPLSVSAKDAFGYAAKSDSGTKLYLVTNKDELKVDADNDSVFDNTYLTLAGGVYPASSGGFQGYSTKSDSSLWLKLIDTRDLTSNILLVNIKPAWINTYSMTNTSPQRQGEFWQETISSLDAYKNTVTDVSHLTTHASRTLTLGLPDAYRGRSSDDPLKFYLTTTASGGNPLEFSLTSDSTTVYLKDTTAETIELGVTGMVYSYGIGDYASLSATETSFTSGPIIILGWGYRVMANFNYDQDNDVLYISTWLEKESSIISPASGESATLTIYDSNGSSLKGLSDDTASSGIYHLQWSTSLTETNYLAKVELTHESETYRRDFSFIVEPDIILAETMTQTLEVKLDEEESAIKGEPEIAEEKIIEALEAIDAGLDRVLVATERDGTIYSRLETLTTDELKPLVQARIVNTSAHVLRGEDLVVTFQTYPSLSSAPVLDVYDPDGEQLTIVNPSMEELSEEGFYQTTFTFDETAGKGSYTLVCSESTYGTMDAFSVEVGLTSMEKLSRDVSSILGRLVGLPELKNINSGLQSTFDNLALQMDELVTQLIFVSKGKISSILRTEVFRQRRQNMRVVFDGLGEIKDGLFTTGLFPQKMIDDIFALSEEKALDITYLQNQMNTAEVLLRMLQGILDNLINVPVQEYWFEFR